MADSDDDYLDLCEEQTSPQKDRNIHCSNTEISRDNANGITVSSSDNEPENVENYRDFESDDISSTATCKHDSKNNAGSILSDFKEKISPGIVLYPSEGRDSCSTKSLKFSYLGNEGDSDDRVISAPTRTERTSEKQICPNNNNINNKHQILRNCDLKVSSDIVGKNICTENKEIKSCLSTGKVKRKPQTDSCVQEDVSPPKKNRGIKIEKRVQDVCLGVPSKLSSQELKFTRKRLQAQTGATSTFTKMLPVRTGATSSLIDRLQTGTGATNTSINRLTGRTASTNTLMCNSPTRTSSTITSINRSPDRTGSTNTSINRSPVRTGSNNISINRSPVRIGSTNTLFNRSLARIGSSNTLMNRFLARKGSANILMNRLPDTCSTVSANTSTNIKAAIKLKEIFPNLSADEIEEKIKSLNVGVTCMTEEEVIDAVVEDICSGTQDVQIALANPKIHINQEVKSNVLHTKPKVTNSAKGKSLMKKVVPMSTMDVMDVDMDCQRDDSDIDFQDVSLDNLEAVVTEPTEVKLRWDPATCSEKNLRYIVEMQTAPSFMWTTVVKDVHGTVYIVSNLDPKQNYRFRVLARNQLGDVSKPSPVASVCRTVNASDNNTKLARKEAPATVTSGGDVSQEEVSSSTLACEACQFISTCDKLVQCCDGHLNCNTCVEKIVKRVLSHGSNETTISCGYRSKYECNSYIPESQSKKVLPSIVFELLEDKINKKASESIEKMTDLYSCPSCQFKVFIDGDLKKFHCPQCKKAICRYCGKEWNNDSSHTECTFNTFMASSDMDVTSTWCTIPEGYKDFVAVQLGENTQKEYNFVLTLFNKQIDKRTTVNKIFRLQNPRLWQKYSLAKDHLIQDIGKDNINEQHLFHGTANKAVGGICREGLDWRMCGKNGTAFGQGTYFAKNSSYSLRYCGDELLKGGVTSGNLLGSLFGFRQLNNNPSATNTGTVFPGNQNTIPLHIQSLNSNIQQQNTGFGFFGTTPSIYNFGPSPSNTGSQSSGFTFGVAPVYNNTTVNNNPQRQVFYFGANPVPATNNTSNISLFGGRPITNVTFNSNAIGNTTQAPDRNSGNVPLEEQFIDSTKQYLFLARVLVGQSCQGVSGMRKPSRDSQNRPYNSACDNPSHPSIFVIFDSAQCYPEYLIELSGL